MTATPKTDTWQAIAVAPDGWVIPDGEIDQWDPYDIRIDIVTGSATPASEDRDDVLRAVDEWLGHDLIEVFREGDLETADDVAARWAQARAMAAGLNQAVGEATR